MKQKDPSHMATYNGLYTSTRIISNKLVIRSSLAYGQSFNYLEESFTSVNWSKSKDSKNPSTWSFFMFTFQYNSNSDATS